MINRMKRNWAQQKLYERIAFILELILLAIIVINSTLYFLGIHTYSDIGLYLFVPVLIAQSVICWRKDRLMAIMGICVAIFLLLILLSRFVF